MFVPLEMAKDHSLARDDFAHCSSCGALCAWLLFDKRRKVGLLELRKRWVGICCCCGRTYERRYRFGALLRTFVLLALVWPLVFFLELPFFLVLCAFSIAMLITLAVSPIEIVTPVDIACELAFLEELFRNCGRLVDADAVRAQALVLRQLQDASTKHQLSDAERTILT